MPTCRHCETRWTYIDWLKNWMRYICPNCGEKNYVRKKRIRDILIVILIPVIVIFILPLFGLSFFGKIAFGFILLAIYLATYPFNLTLSKEEEPYF